MTYSQLQTSLTIRERKKLYLRTIDLDIDVIDDNQDDDDKDDDNENLELKFWQYNDNTMTLPELGISLIAPTAFPNVWMQPLLLSSEANFRPNTPGICPG